jgi:hypothetical protein
MADRPATAPGPALGQLSSLRVGPGFQGTAILFSPLRRQK